MRHLLLFSSLPLQYNLVLSLRARSKPHQIVEAAANHSGPINVKPVSEEEYGKAYRLSRLFCKALDALDMLRKIEHGDLSALAGAHVSLRDNPFLLCDLGLSDLKVLEKWRHLIADGPEWTELLSNWEQMSKPPVLDSIGKLAKAGVFWKTPFPGHGFLLKSVRSGELDVLASISSKAAAEYGDCKGFRKTLLLPISFSFSDAIAGVDYIVMRNETLRLAGAVGKDQWQVVRKWDVKPLPSISDDLTAVLLALSIGNKESGSSMNEWAGWDVVRGSLQHSVNVLNAAKVVDYSLFIHVLQPLMCGSEACNPETSAELTPENGCVMDPDHEKVVCFKILDYLTQYDFYRGLESFGKGDKFDKYSDKFMMAFDCLGDISRDLCHTYTAHVDLDLASREENPDTAEIAFLRSSLFAAQYQCKVEYPHMKYTVVAGMGNPITVSHPDVGAAPVVAMRSENKSYREDIAEWLQKVASATVVAPDYGDLLQQVHSIRAAAAMEEVGASYPLPPGNLKRCGKGIRDFATLSWFNRRTHTDLDNVFWSAQTEAVFVVRNKPTFSSYDGVVTDLRFDECFLDARLYRCRPSRGWTVQTNYTTKFGAFEILQVSGAHYSRDYKAWSDFHLRPGGFWGS